MKTKNLQSAGLCMCLLACLSGCERPSPAQSSGSVPGAFPPTLSDADYHQDSWTRTDCLVCHETGVQQAPKVKHFSVPATALEAKCRTCHVLIPNSEPKPRP